ncbi:hypothetical protein AKO1_010806 [Acrasis kona]|uniref:Arf-GAP domain-containing protein n=1 Tax=Acrasis kona TaxID=1008807 RepID=A0AAW2YKS0_9EUKA
MKSSATHDRNKKILLELLKEPGNKYCAECGARGPLCWASVNLGIFFCTKCAGVHRGIGVHISFVRGVNLDQWEDKHMEAVTRIGNERSNAIYEAGMPPNKKPNENSSPREIEEFIRQKYEKKKWVVRNGSDDNHRESNQRSRQQEEPKQNARPRREIEYDEHETRNREPVRQQQQQRQPSREQPQHHSNQRDEYKEHRQVQQKPSSGFSNLRSNPTSQQTQIAPPKQTQKPDLLAFGDMAFDSKNSNEASLDDIFAGAFSSNDNQQHQQQQQQQQQQKINTQKSAQSNILNMFDKPMVPTSPHQNQPPFGNPQQRGPPMMMPPQYGHPPLQPYGQHPQQYGHPGAPQMYGRPQYAQPPPMQYQQQQRGPMMNQPFPQQQQPFQQQPIYNQQRPMNGLPMSGMQQPRGF